MKNNSLRQAALAGLLCLATQETAAGQEAASAASSSLLVELNRAETVASGCLLSVYAQNDTGADINALVLETVLITSKGAVDRLTLLDLGRLPNGRPRVRQFEIAGIECESLGTLLVNGVNRCDASGIDPAGCDDAIKLRSKSRIEVAG